jgi:hypothetical protein
MTILQLIRTFDKRSFRSSLNSHSLSHLFYLHPVNCCAKIKCVNNTDPATQSNIEVIDKETSNAYLTKILTTDFVLPSNKTLNLIQTKYLTAHNGIAWCVDITYFGKDFVFSMFIIDLGSRLIIHHKTLYKAFNIDDCVLVMQEAILIQSTKPKIVHSDVGFNNEHWKVTLFNM